MKDINTKDLISIYKTDYEIAYIDQKEKLHFTNDLEKDFDSMDLKYLFFTSDFESMFNIKDELTKRSKLWKI